MSKRKKSRRSRARTKKRAAALQHPPEPAVQIDRGSSKHVIAYYLALICGALIFSFLIYSNSLNGPFLFDDTNNIQYNNAIKLTDLSLDGIWSAAFDSPHPRRFVAYVSFALNYYFHQEQMLGYHVVNILIHAFTSVLVYQFAAVTLSLPTLKNRYPRYREIALFVALLWLVHPMAAQSVAYLVQRMNSLATMFYMLALVSYIQGRKSTGRKQRSLWYAFCVLSACLAMGSKEIAATLPFFLILYEWFFFQDLDQKWIRRYLPFIVALVALVVIVGFLAKGGNVSGWFDYRTFTMGERILTQFRVVIFYLSLLLLPHPSRLTINHDVSHSTGLLEPETTLLAIVAVAGLLATAIFSAKRERLLSFSILWYFGHLMIESSILPLELIFEHRTYLPSVGLILLGAAMWYRFTTRFKYQFVPLVVLVVVWSFWAHERSHVWSDRVSFWSDAAEKSPEVARIYNNLGVAYEERENLDEALMQYRKAFSLDPGLYRALNNIGSIQLAKKNYDAALSAFNQSRELNSRDVDAYKGLALTYYAMGNRQQYLEYLNKVNDMEGRRNSR